MYNISNLPNHLKEPLTILSHRYGFSISEKGRNLSFTSTDKPYIDITADEENIIIVSNHLSGFFRGIGILIEQEQNGTLCFHLHEDSWFDFNGLMIDCSRNGVVSIPYIKELIEQLAVMGHTMLMLYMEDVYEVDGEPYFGYMRGRYSKEELKMLDDYAFQFGIELIPCIQTLAHFDQFLSMDTVRDEYIDIDNILDVSSPNVQDLLRRMIHTLSSCFRSRRIHIGMDEAYHLGRGRYADKNGLRSKHDIMSEHMDFMLSVCKEYGLRPIIWDDMFIHYQTRFDTGQRSIPEDIDLMYWDYYNNTEEHYEKNLQMRASLSSHLMFAGGAWKWTGYAPHHSKTIASANAALSVCKRQGIRQVMVTSWADDGCECPISACLFGAVLFAEHQYNETIDMDSFQHRLKFITRLDYETFMKQEEFDIFPSFSNRAVTVTPSKYLLYEDPLCSLFLLQAESIQEDLTMHYQNLSDYFYSKARDCSIRSLRAALSFYGSFGSVMALKWNLGLNIYKAYRNQDKIALQSIIENQLLPLIPRLEFMNEMRRREWYITNKSFGFEVLDYRIGALIQRLKTTRTILSSYINDIIPNIPELEEERLSISKFREEGMGEIIHFNNAERSRTTNRTGWV
ncbi:Glycosyl hydrolase family 20, catalytic domain [Clostridiales bacterium CHKCI001]|nr:Glycosyl hydrolase family 20, catalytic domain [Clostridiales bacterium CHKCI001]